jgi:hypothetical protein
LSCSGCDQPAIDQAHPLQREKWLRGQNAAGSVLEGRPRAAAHISIRGANEPSPQTLDG